MASGPTGHEQTVLARADGSLVEGGIAKRCPTCGGEYPSEFLVCPKDATPLGDSTANGDALIGVVLAGTFRITKLMAEGGMGRLYEAEHIRIERPCAIKVIHQAYAGMGAIVARFDREARAQSRIRSPHVVEVHDVLRTPDGRPCMVLEKLEGEDLEDHLDRIGGKLPLRAALTIARQMCRGLAAAHAVGVIHRDLKPSNIFVLKPQSSNAPPFVKILDFGVAKVREDAQLTATGAVLGTPAYMAPEQARSSAKVDARGDIYGVGAVLYCMVTGRPPYDQGDATSTLSKLLEEAPPRPSTIDGTIPIGLEALIQRAMAREPGERPQTIEALDAELGAFETTLGPEGGRLFATPGSALESAGDMTRRAKRARPVGAALVVPAVIAPAAAVAGMLSAFVAGVGDGVSPMTSGEMILVWVGGAVAGLAVLVAHLRALITSWSSAPAVEALTRRVGLSLMAGLVALGVLELATRAVGIATGLPLATSGTWVALRLFGGILAAVAFFVLVQRRRRR